MPESMKVELLQQAAELVPELCMVQTNAETLQRELNYPTYLALLDSATTTYDKACKGRSRSVMFHALSNREDAQLTAKDHYTPITEDELFDTQEGELYGDMDLSPKYLVQNQNFLKANQKDT